MDRADAIRLLRALAAAGMNTRAPKANAWIKKKALEIGLEGSHFVSALAYAGNEGWFSADTFNVPSAAGGTRPVQVVACR